MSLNVGILGHVDSGKTTLTRAIAEVASTNAFDKHAEKGGRKNTLDLGFSCCFVGGHRLALIDCPGHAGLIRAVLAASSVFDMALVVVDASSGIQPQTAEHLLLCSIFCPERVIVVLNKIDLVDSKEIPTITNRVKKGLKALGISEATPIVPLSLNPPSEELLRELMFALEQKLFIPERIDSGRLLIAVDHCFPLKGKGSILTGTVIDGTVRMNQEIEIPSLKEIRKVKGLECWKEKKNEVPLGERAAILLQNFNCDQISRTMICSPSGLKEVQYAFCSVVPVNFYKGTVNTGTKIHISTGFETLMGEVIFLSASKEILEQPSTSDEFEQLPSMSNSCIAVIELDRPVFVRPGFFYIASKLDHQGKGCRFAFHGKILSSIDGLTNVRRFVRKHREGQLERVENSRSAICNSMFKKETKMSIFEGMSVVLSTGDVGKIESSFGKNEMSIICARAHLGRLGVRWLSSRGNYSSSSKNIDIGDDGLPKDYKVKILRAGSRRLDTFVNRATGKSSSQVEKLLSGGKVRVNEDVCTKKSYNIQQEDVIDVFIGPYPENSDLAEVERSEVVDYTVTDKGYDINIKSWKKFLVENWRTKI